MYIVNQFIENIENIDEYIKENWIVILGNIYFDKMEQIYYNKYHKNLCSKIEELIEKGEKIRWNKN